MVCRMFAVFCGERESWRASYRMRGKWGEVAGETIMFGLLK
jgi:hypothetical protein